MYDEATPKGISEEQLNVDRQEILKAYNDALKNESDNKAHNRRYSFTMHPVWMNVINSFGDTINADNLKILLSDYTTLIASKDEDNKTKANLINKNNTLEEKVKELTNEVKFVEKKYEGSYTQDEYYQLINKNKKQREDLIKKNKLCATEFENAVKEHKSMKEEYDQLKSVSVRLNRFGRAIKWLVTK